MIVVSCFYLQFFNDLKARRQFLFLCKFSVASFFQIFHGVTKPSVRRIVDWMVCVTIVKRAGNYISMLVSDHTCFVYQYVQKSRKIQRGCFILKSKPPLLSVCMCLCFYLSNYLSISILYHYSYLSIYQLIYLSIYIYPSIYSFICLSIYFSIYLYLSTYLSFRYK